MVNDKIYELARQADMIEFDSIPGSKAMTPSYESIVKARKFAELIVKECAKVADDGFASSNFGNGITGQQLLKHFGVEE
jgi:hypothetical protein